MPAAVLVQRPKEQAQVAGAKRGVGIVSVESRIDSISLSKTERDTHSTESRPFDFDVDMSELSRSQDGISVRYSFTFGRPASGRVCKVSGVALVRFSQFNPASDFQTLGSYATSEMAVEIFRRNYEFVYLLHDAVAMDAPSPWVTQDVSLSSRDKAADDPLGNL